MTDFVNGIGLGATQPPWIPPVENPKDVVERAILLFVRRQEIAAERMEEAAARIEQLSESANDRAAKILSRHAMAEIPAAVRFVVSKATRQEHIRWLLISVGASVLACLLALWMLWPGDRICSVRNGGEFCGHWVVPEQRR
jgi:hypothetical protein